MDANTTRHGVTPNIIELPNEIWFKIFSFLPQIDHHAVGLVSNRFEKIIYRVKLAETSKLEITEKNVEKIRADIANKNCKLSFKRVKLENVKKIEDLNYILQSIGKQIQFLSIKNTAAFDILKCNVIYLKSLEIYFDEILASSVNSSLFNLRIFPRLEQLTFLNNQEMHSTTNKLLEQLKLQKNTSKLKYFKLYCRKESEQYLINSLLHHTTMLETLDLHFLDHDITKKWEIPFSRMKNLKEFRLSGNFSDQMMNAFFSMLPKETSLELLELDGKTSIEINKMLTLNVKKWKTSLHYLKLNNGKLTDVAVIELGKLHKLRVLKLLNCTEITKIGLLMGIAIEKNVIIEELHLDNLPNLDELGLRVLVSRFPNLRVLTLNNLEKAITNTSLASICRYSTRLRSLHINNCINMTDDGLVGFGNNPCSIDRLRFLEHLALGRCRCFTDRIFIKALNLPALKFLELRDCHNITMKGIESLVKSCPSLESLSLPSTIMISDNALFVIKKGLKLLKLIGITDCYNITEEIRDYIRNIFKAQRGSIHKCKIRMEI